MTTGQALVRSEGGAGGELAPWEQQLEVVRRMCAPDATADEFQVFCSIAKRAGLDPLARQIYCIVRGSGNNRRAVIQTGIDGYRLIAERTGDYAGSDPPVFEAEPGSKIPLAATVTVHKFVRGHLRPFSATAYWEEFYPDKGQSFMWDKMPRHMLAKVAEAQALRKGFPADLSGIYTEEELDQADARGVVGPEERARAIPGKARAIDVAPEGQSRLEQKLGQSTGNGDPAERPPPPASERQVAAIYELGGGRGWDQETTDRWSLQQFGGLAPADLNRQQAEQAIAALNKQG